MIGCDVAIIGGGLMGTWTAFFLRRRGCAVAVLDKGEIGAQASGVNFGNLRVQGRFAGQIPLLEHPRALAGDPAIAASVRKLRSRVTILSVWLYSRLLRIATGNFFGPNSGLGHTHC